MYFRLNPECHFIKGKRKGAIFDLIDGKIYCLNENETKLVTSCERDELINEGDNFLKELKTHCVGNMYKNKVYIPKLNVGSVFFSSSGARPQIHRAYVEINNSCNKNCWFCGYYGIKRSLGCVGCNKWNEGGELLSLKRCKRLFEELNKLDCKEIFIKGGDLTLSWDRTISVLDYAGDIFKHIYITLHRQNITENIINDLKNRYKLIVQSESLEDIPYEAHTILLTLQPYNPRNNRIYDRNVLIDYLINDTKVFVNNFKKLSKQNMHLNIYQFMNNKSYHPCLGHSLAICHNGDIIPCPMMRTHKLGNVKNGKLCSIFKNGAIYKFWNLNLDKIEKCNVCEFRYVCNDCRCLEEHLSGSLTGKELCNYNPIEGKWIQSDTNDTI